LQADRRAANQVFQTDLKYCCPWYHCLVCPMFMIWSGLEFLLDWTYDLFYSLLSVLFSPLCASWLLYNRKEEFI
jgi:hypothetical protein